MDLSFLEKFDKNMIKKNSCSETHWPAQSMICTVSPCIKSLRAIENKKWGSTVNIQSKSRDLGRHVLGLRLLVPTQASMRLMLFAAYQHSVRVDLLKFHVIV